MTKKNYEPITFGDIQKGDRLRVRYTDGGRERGSNKAYRPEACVSVTRVIVAETELLALNKAWLDEDGHTVVHRDWDDLNIVRISGEKVEVPVRIGEVWTAKELDALRNWEIPDKLMARKLGRTKASVSVKRSALRKAFNLQLMENTGKLVSMK